MTTAAAAAAVRMKAASAATGTPAAVSVNENQTTVMTVTATDPDDSSSGGGGPSTSTVGKITNFNSACYSMIKIDDVNYGVHNGNKSYSLTKIDDYEMRFEVRKGDHPPSDGDVERSSIQCDGNRQPVGGIVTAELKFFVEPGPVCPDAWFFVLIQGHNADGDMPWGVYTSPPIDVEFVGDKLQFYVLWCPTNQNPSNSAGNVKKVLIYETPQKLTRNAWHTVKIEAKNQNDNSGYYKAWIDGTQVANYSGPVGFGYKVYWERGPYRATDSTPFAVKMRNIKMVM